MSHSAIPGSSESLRQSTKRLHSVIHAPAVRYCLMQNKSATLSGQASLPPVLPVFEGFVQPVPNVLDVATPDLSGVTPSSQPNIALSMVRINLKTFSLNGARFFLAIRIDAIGTNINTTNEPAASKRVLCAEECVCRPLKCQHGPTGHRNFFKFCMIL